MPLLLDQSTLDALVVKARPQRQELEQLLAKEVVKLAAGRYSSGVCQLNTSRGSIDVSIATQSDSRPYHMMVSFPPFSGYGKWAMFPRMIKLHLTVCGIEVVWTDELQISSIQDKFYAAEFGIKSAVLEDFICKAVVADWNQAPVVAPKYAALATQQLLTTYAVD